MLLRRIFEPKRERTEEHCIMRNFTIPTLHEILLV
jgi:hypothetical protein